MQIIDGTLDLLKELKKPGYDSEYEIKYNSYDNAKHEKSYTRFLL